MGNKKITFAQIKKGTDDRDAAGQPLNFYPLGYLSPYVSYFFARFLPFTPNQISFIWFILGIIGCLVMAIGGYWYAVLGLLIYYFADLLDYVDGEIARATKKTSIGGTYMDRLSHYVHRGLILLGLGIGVYNISGKIIYLYLGLWSCLLLILDNLAKLKVYETLINEKRLDIISSTKNMYVKQGYQNFVGTFSQRIKAYAFEMLRPNDPFTLSFFAIVFNFVPYYLIFMAPITLILFVKTLNTIYKSIGNIKTKKALND